MAQDELEFKNSTEMNQYHRAMMREEARITEDIVVWIGLVGFFVLGFLALLTFSLGLVFILGMFI